MPLPVAPPTHGAPGNAFRVRRHADGALRSVCSPVPTCSMGACLLTCPPWALCCVHTVLRRSAEFVIAFNKGIDAAANLLEAGLASGVIQGKVRRWRRPQRGVSTGVVSTAQHAGCHLLVLCTRLSLTSTRLCCIGLCGACTAVAATARAELARGSWHVRTVTRCCCAPPPLPPPSFCAFFSPLPPGLLLLCGGAAAGSRQGGGVGPVGAG